MMDKETTRLNNKWCPYGRISIQRWENGQFREAVQGAYNMVVPVDRTNGLAGTIIQPASPCQRELCALYKKGIFPWGKGRCGLESSATGPWVFAALLAMEVIAISATFILNRFG